MHRIFLLTICLFSAAIVSAQENVPYTRYAIGFLSEPEFSFLRGWGNVSAAYHHPLHVNVANPASYSYFASTTFEGGLYGSYLGLTSSDSSTYSGDGSVSHFALGVPIVKNKWGLALGLLPYSRVRYNVLETNDSTNEFGQSYNSYSGSGGLYQFFGGTGFRVKGFSAGINAAYLFGNIRYVNMLLFEDTLNAYETRVQEQKSYSDFLFTGGVQYEFKIMKQEDKTYKYHLTIGANGNLKTSVNTTRDFLWERVITPSGVIIPKDTIAIELGETGETILPASFSAGIIFTANNKISVGVNYKFANWSSYSAFNDEQNYTGNSWLASAGTEWIPDPKAYQQYWKTISYRIGGMLGQDYIQFDDKQFKRYGLSAGVGLPLRTRILTQLSKVDLSFQYQKLGSIKENPLAISYWRLNFGFTLSERWFQRPKYD